jgi:hypothetical protein
MGEKVATVATTIVAGVTAVAIFTHPQTRNTVRALGGAFTGALGQIVAASGRGPR